jgi:RimJ/RimL family protein N-acetyltransferase
VIIREVAPADSSTYFSLRVQSEQEYPQFVGFNAERELAAEQSGIVALLSSYPSEGTIVWGAFEGIRVVGVLALSRRLSRKYAHKALLWGMYVIPEFRGGGAAHALMNASITWATEHSEIVAITLQVALSNIRALQFYKRLGFTVFGTEQRSLFAAGQFHAVHYMELEVMSGRPE